MPVEFPTFDGDDDPPLVLANFLKAVRKFLAELVETDRDSLGDRLFVRALRNEMLAAWEEAQVHFDLAIERAENSYLRLQPGNALYEHGLYGRQLRFKLAVIRYFYGQYLSVGKGILKKLIEMIDDLLKSILDAIGAGGAISEIKDFIKDSIDD
jgi:hypothetical protein